MRATERFISHLDGHSRWFELGEEVPPEWAAMVGKKHLLSGGSVADVDPFAEFEELHTISEVLDWIDRAADDIDRVKRATHAYEVELEAASPRATLLARLRDLTDGTSTGVSSGDA